VVYPVLEFREEKQTFAEIEGGNVDFLSRQPDLRHVECRPLWACLLQRLKSPIQTVRACLLEGLKTGPDRISRR